MEKCVDRKGGKKGLFGWDNLTKPLVVPWRPIVPLFLQVIDFYRLQESSPGHHLPCKLFIAHKFPDSQGLSAARYYTRVLHDGVLTPVKATSVHGSSSPNRSLHEAPLQT